MKKEMIFDIYLLNNATSIRFCDVYYVELYKSKYRSCSDNLMLLNKSGNVVGFIPFEFIKNNLKVSFKKERSITYKIKLKG